MKKLCLLMTMLCALLTACKPFVDLPDVSTKEVSMIGSHSAQCGGEVLSDGFAIVIARGVCWSTKHKPKVSDSYTMNGDGIGSFTSYLEDLEPNTRYYVRAYATTVDGTSYGDEVSFTTLDPEYVYIETGRINGYAYVDLGLPSGLKWATCNMGATSPESYGDYYAWGETETKDTYTEKNCLTWYEQMSDISGNLQYDVARKIWGDTWRMPTEEEQSELIDHCTWLWTDENGFEGYKVVGPNGNSIFFPAAGYRIGSSLIHAGGCGYYWTSTPDDDYSNNSAYFLSFNSGDQDCGTLYRYYGRSVRPVSGGDFEEPLIVNTNDVSEITENSAVCGGDFMSGSSVTAKGVCWNTYGYPTIDDNKTNCGSGNQSFVSELTGLKPVTTYYVRAYATNEAGTRYGEEKIFTTKPKYVIDGYINGYAYVDLGLPSGLKWANCNIGANKPEEYGNYYAWGETEPAPNNNYSYSKCSTSELSESELQSQGYIDGEGNLTPQYDAATANWGGDWRMPTYDELRELNTKCTWKWVNNGNDFKGYNVTGPNGNSIFLPAAGYRNESSLYDAGSGGDYWSSTPYVYYVYEYYLYACYLGFGSSSHSMLDYRRYYGRSVRPVLE